jgi:cytochrome P450
MGGSSAFRAAPEPRGYPLVGVLPSLLRDPFRFLMQTAREHEGIVRLRVAGREAFLLSDPDYVDRVLVEHPDIHQRGAIFDTFRAVIGDGLFTADGDVWRRHRRIMTPVFHRRHVHALVDRITEVVGERCHAWREHADGEGRVDMFQEMIGLNTRILLRTLFGTTLREDDTRALVDTTGARLPKEAAMAARTPKQCDDQFGRYIEAGDVEAVVALYEPKACLVLSAGTVARGTKAIRKAISMFAAMKPKFRMNVTRVVKAGDDLAVLYND